MVIATDYAVCYDEDKQAHRIVGTSPSQCPSCGIRLSGYDTRRRRVIDSAGDVHWLLLRRLRCPKCKAIHTEIPAFIMPRKHYEAAVIKAVLTGHSDSCPADDSTIRRWKEEG